MPVLGVGAKHYCLVALLSNVEWVLIENSVFVPLSARTIPEANYYS